MCDRGWGLLCVHVIRQDELQVIVYVHVASVTLPQSVAMLKLHFHRIRVDDSCSHWQIVHESMEETKNSLGTEEPRGSCRGPHSQMHKILVFDSLHHLL